MILFAKKIRKRMNWIDETKTLDVRKNFGGPQPPTHKSWRKIAIDECAAHKLDDLARFSCASKGSRRNFHSPMGIEITSEEFALFFDHLPVSRNQKTALT